MVDQATIQAKANYGYKIAAEKIAATYAIYRSQDTGPPIVPANLIFSLPVAVDTNAGFTYALPAKAESDAFYAMLDLTNIQTGDYIVGQEGTFFIGYIEPFKTVTATRCPRTITISRGGDLVDQPGLQSVANYDEESWEVIAQNIPCSILPDRERGKPPAAVPGDVISRLMFKVSMSPAYGQTSSTDWWQLLRQGDQFVEDESDIRYRVSEVLFMPSNWFLRAELLTPSAG